ncbi:MULTISPECIES: efflux RND transporter periplasmic adaptor subunit [unclassified Siphonobacter]|uniref:efflux RND transporter periplasmic adaptor subunit n=1 Tax=unclassified Siphonobacter TaxID=2635712 RepID=UPI000CB1197B|nr:MULTISPECIES: efflux RND transporter periplasmic adaptor subunit [unclassified Siphonobacter]MDQ1087614.1 membrane fusion protein (multidrug efflux system) [Siphonobacter sp. SORGH_AS_1065]MDR6193765.1 membrane fusion protein (multidrug efflux system) [Siphonobacter sp. SORGH_AS_0500]PKK37943.1 efflux transporter periplasmic adaptor subunit [Siphonobacter sp. SORGH_AS_0500]
MKRILMLMSLSGLFYLTSCESKHEEKEEETKYLVTSPAQMDTLITQNYVCQIHSISHIELRAQERGYLQNIYVDEGKFVKKGQLLFRIMPNIYQAEMEKAQAEAKAAEIEVENTRPLAEKNVVAKNELAMANAKLEKAKAELSLAKVHLQFTEIRAPFDGIIDRFQVRLGSLVDEGQLLTTLSDNRQLWVYFNVPEAEYLNFKAHNQTDDKMKVHLLMANNELFPHVGVVETIEADFNNETGNIAFRATFPNPKGLLRHGETGNIQMTVPLKNALIIPQKATFEVLEKRYVFVVGKDNKVHTREINIAAEMPDLYVVRDGLKADEKILLEGIRKVKDGDKITFDYEDPKAVIPKLKVYSE